MTPTEADRAERASLLEQVEELRLGLFARATGGGMEPSRYHDLRKTLLAATTVAGHMPRFLRVCRTIDDFWEWIRAESPNYAGRRQLITEALRPVIDVLEGLENVSQAELVFGDLLGRGGFGSVYRARHKLLDMDFAVKVFDPAFDDGGPAHLQRFFLEARMLFTLNHPNIVRIFDAGIFQGRPFIRMEYFDGKNASQFLKEHGLLPPKKALVLIQKLLSALVHAHDEVKLVHRDLKPSNVMLAPGERVKIVDFGLGVFIESEGASRITRTGEAAAGGHFTAPELLENSKLIDPRTDLFSVGAIWYTVLTGRPPAGSDVHVTLGQTVALPPRYHATVMKSLAAPTARYQTAQEMLAAVEALRSAYPPVSMEPQPGETK